MLEHVRTTKGVRTDDTIIAFMGPTGSGKSFFIDLLTGEEGRRSGNTIASVTDQIETIRIKHPSDEDKRIVLVDTPGFDDTTRSDMQILQMISDWLQNTYVVRWPEYGKLKKPDRYQQGVKLSGLIYLHRITDNRMTGSPYKNLRMFGELCGDIAMSRVVLVSTMWGKISFEIGVAREEELRGKFWKPLIDRGSSVDRLATTEREEAWRVVKQLIAGHERREAVLLQEEMVDLGIKLNETQAGKTLYTSLQKQLADQKDALKKLLVRVEKVNDPALAKELRKEYARIEEDFQRTFEEAKKFKVSLGARVAGMFRRKKTKAKAVKITR